MGIVNRLVFHLKTLVQKDIRTRNKVIIPKAIQAGQKLIMINKTDEKDIKAISRKTFLLFLSLTDVRIEPIKTPITIVKKIAKPSREIATVLNDLYSIISGMPGILLQTLNIDR